MGGKQSSTQVRQYIQQTVSNVVSSTLMSKSTTVDQSYSQQQVIRRIVINPVPYADYCPKGT